MFEASRCTHGDRKLPHQPTERQPEAERNCPNHSTKRMAIIQCAMGAQRILGTEEGLQHALQLHTTSRQPRIQKPANLERVHKVPLLERVELDSIAMTFAEEDGQIEAVNIVPRDDYPVEGARKV